MPTKVYIIYNANGTFLGELAYLSKKLLGISNCQLCEITHSISELGEKKEFRQMESRLILEFKLLHKDELLDGMDEIIEIHGLPIVLANNYQVLLTNDELMEMKGSIELFELKLKKKLNI